MGLRFDFSFFATALFYSVFLSASWRRCVFAYYYSPDFRPPSAPPMWRPYYYGLPPLQNRMGLIDTNQYTPDALDERIGGRFRARVDPAGFNVYESALRQGVRPPDGAAAELRRRQQLISGRPASVAVSSRNTTINITAAATANNSFPFPARANSSMPTPNASVYRKLFQNIKQTEEAAEATVAQEAALSDAVATSVPPIRVEALLDHLSSLTKPSSLKRNPDNSIAIPKRPGAKQPHIIKSNSTFLISSFEATTSKPVRTAPTTISQTTTEEEIEEADAAGNDAVKSQASSQQAITVTISDSNSKSNAKAKPTATPSEQNSIIVGPSQNTVSSSNTQFVSSSIKLLPAPTAAELRKAFQKPSEDDQPLTPLSQFKRPTATSLEQIKSSATGIVPVAGSNSIQKQQSFSATVSVNLPAVALPATAAALQLGTFSGETNPPSSVMPTEITTRVTTTAKPTTTTVSDVLKVSEKNVSTKVLPPLTTPVSNQLPVREQSTTLTSSTTEATKVVLRAPSLQPPAALFRPAQSDTVREEKPVIVAMHSTLSAPNSPTNIITENHPDSNRFASSEEEEAPTFTTLHVNSKLQIHERPETKAANKSSTLCDRLIGSQSNDRDAIVSELVRIVEATLASETQFLDPTHRRRRIAERIRRQLFGIVEQREQEQSAVSFLSQPVLKIQPQPPPPPPPRPQVLPMHDDFNMIEQAEEAEEAGRRRRRPPPQQQHVIPARQQPSSASRENELRLQKQQQQQQLVEAELFRRRQQELEEQQRKLQQQRLQALAADFNFNNNGFLRRRIRIPIPRQGSLLQNGRGGSNNEQQQDRFSVASQQYSLYNRNFNEQLPARNNFSPNGQWSPQMYVNSVPPPPPKLPTAYDPPFANPAAPPSRTDTASSPHLFQQNSPLPQAAPSSSSNTKRKFFVQSNASTKLRVTPLVQQNSLSDIRPTTDRINFSNNPGWMADGAAGGGAEDNPIFYPPPFIMRL